MSLLKSFTCRCGYQVTLRQGFQNAQAEELQEHEHKVCRECKELKSINRRDPDESVKMPLLGEGFPVWKCECCKEPLRDPDSAHDNQIKCPNCEEPLEEEIVAEAI